jgi:hypothetical protein
MWWVGQWRAERWELAPKSEWRQVETAREDAQLAGPDWRKGVKGENCCRLYSPFGPWPLFSFLIYSQSVGLLGRVISPSQGLYLYTGHHKHRINTYTHQISMLWVGFEPTITASEPAKTVHDLDRSATVTGSGLRIENRIHKCTAREGLILSRNRGVFVDGVWIGYWIYWHNSELQEITTPSLISTFYKSLAHAKSSQSLLVVS